MAGDSWLGVTPAMGAALLLWSFEQPVSPDETAAFLDRLTNTVVDPRTGELGWL